MTDKNEQHPILDDPYAKPVKFTWFDGLFLLILFAPIYSDAGVVLAAAFAFYARAGCNLLRKESVKGVLIDFIGATVFLIVWMWLG